MDWTDPRAVEVFFDVHRDLPREGPGDRASTARALKLAGVEVESPRVLDIACGPGMQTMDLATLLPGARITALDFHEPFLREVATRAERLGFGNRVRAVLADMRALPFRDGLFDLVWCEGGAYVLGLERALQAWRPLLAPGGALALTEPVWLDPDPPEPLRRWWEAGYPGMGDARRCRASVRACGYDLLGDFVLPERAWWEHYYDPMLERLTRLGPKYAGDPVAEAVLQEALAEIDFYRSYSSCYGYLFLVAAPIERAAAEASSRGPA